MFEIRDTDIAKHALSSSSLGSALAGSNSSSADSNELKTDSRNELQFTLQDVSATPSALSITKENAPIKTESKLILSTNSLAKLIRAPSNTPTHSNAVQEAEAEDLSQDDQQLSSEAQQLAQDIVEQSMDLSDSHSSTGDNTLERMTVKVNEAEGETTKMELQETHKIQLAAEQEVLSNEKYSIPQKQDVITKSQSEVSISNKSSSAIVVDMTQLNIN